MVFLQTNMKWLFTNQWWIVSFPWLTEACPENRSYVKFCTFGMDGWTFRSHNWLFSSKKKIIWVSKNSNVPSCQSLRKVFDFFRGGGGRAVQKIHALVHVCCFCVISAFDFVWLHHDCIMTASWLHPDSITALICVVQTLWGRKRWSTQLTQFCSKPQTARLPSETQSRFRGLDFSAFPDRTPHKKSWVCLKSMGKPLVKPLVNQNYPCHLTATATNHCWTHPTIILLYKGFHKWGYPKSSIDRLDFPS